MECMYHTKMLTRKNWFNSLHARYFLILLLSSADLFFKINFFKKIFQENSQFGLGQDRRFIVGPDLNPDCLQRLSVMMSQFVLDRKFMLRKGLVDYIKYCNPESFNSDNVSSSFFYLMSGEDPKI